MKKYLGWCLSVFSIRSVGGSMLTQTSMGGTATCASIVAQGEPPFKMTTTRRKHPEVVFLQSKVNRVNPYDGFRHRGRIWVGEQEQNSAMNHWSRSLQQMSLAMGREGQRMEHHGFERGWGQFWPAVHEAKPSNVDEGRNGSRESSTKGSPWP